MCVSKSRGKAQQKDAKHVWHASLLCVSIFVWLIDLPEFNVCVFLCVTGAQCGDECMCQRRRVADGSQGTSALENNYNNNIYLKHNICQDNICIILICLCALIFHVNNMRQHSKDIFHPNISIVCSYIIYIILNSICLCLVMFHVNNLT